MTDLHSRIRTELDRRLAIARAATPGPWTNQGIGDYGWAVHFEGGMPRGVETEDNRQGRDDADFIAQHDPSDAILRYTRDLAVLVRHAAKPVWHGAEIMRYFCVWCEPNPCLDIHDLAESLGIPTTPKGDDEA